MDNRQKLPSLRLTGSLLFLLFGLSQGVCAQEAAVTLDAEPIISWDVEVWMSGSNPATGQPIALLNFPRSGASCNLSPSTVPANAIANPTRIFINDPTNPGRECQLGALTSAGLIASIPAGAGYFLTARARGATQISPRSAPSNSFDRATASPVMPATPKVLP